MSKKEVGHRKRRAYLGAWAEVLLYFPPKSAYQYKRHMRTNSYIRYGCEVEVELINQVTDIAVQIYMLCLFFPRAVLALSTVLAYVFVTLNRGAVALGFV